VDFPLSPPFSLGVFDMSLGNDITRRVFGCLLASVPLALQASQEPVTIKDNVELVLLDVGVRDQHGSYITDLSKDAFKVSVEGRPQTISHFARVDAPVTIGLVVDNSGSMRYKRPEVVLAGLAFAKESNPQDEFFVVNFNDYVSPGLPANVPFTDKLQLLHNALFMGHPSGQTALYDAVAFGLKHLESGHHDKRTLIVVSDGGDNVSELAQHDIVNLIQESRATVYTIGLLDPADNDLKPGILKKFAGISGGEYFEPAKLDEVTDVLGKISKDIRNRYSLGFSPDASVSNKRVRSIKVTAIDDGRKLNVRTRTSFTTSSDAR